MKRTNGKHTSTNGLTPAQEQAVYLLASGKSITDVAKEIKVDRGTLYNWFDLPTFQAFYNGLRQEIKALVNDSLFSMHIEALETMRNCLKSENESLAFKAAVQIIEYVKASDTGLVDVREILRAQCNIQNDLGWLDFNESKYQRLCEQYGVDSE